MPKFTREITSGTQFSRSAENGTVADTQTRAFRVILNQPNEVFNIQDECQVRIGDQHPYNTNIYCTSFDAKYEGDSRLVIVCTFNYSSGASQDSSSGGQDPSSYSPELRPANWSTSTSLMESPVYKWRRRNALYGWASETPAENPAGDIYEAVTQLTSIVNISIEQPEFLDPTKHNMYGGYVNEEEINLGSLNMKLHTVMFRGCQSQPYVESWGGSTYRGWKVTYEFAYKRNVTKVYIGGIEQEVDLGWDIAVPQTGLNVLAFAPPGGADDDVFGQPLQHGDENSTDATLKQFAGRIVDPPALYTGIAAGEKHRAMIKVFSYRGGGASQTPSASPIPLNDNGRPRKATADPKVIVKGYQVQPSINLTTTLKLRLT